MGKSKITTAELRRLFTLDAERGVLIWNSRPLSDFANAQGWSLFRNKYVGKVAGCRWPHCRTFRVRVKVGNRRLFVHRVVYALHHDIEFEDLPEIIDHRDGNGENNIPSNLRAATAQQNQWNIPAKAGSKSGYKGVYPTHQSKNWSAKIYVNGKFKILGSFKTKEIAAQAYRAAALELHGEFARF